MAEGIVMSGKILVIAIALAASTLLPATQAGAQGAYVNIAPTFDAKLAVAESRIDGIRAQGIISQEEYDHLMDRVSRIRDKESKLAEHGGLTAEQQAELYADLRGLDGEMAYLGIGEQRVAARATVHRAARVYTRTTVKRIIRRR
jgi:hypothetical protein